MKENTKTTKQEYSALIKDRDFYKEQFTKWHTKYVLLLENIKICVEQQNDKICVEQQNDKICVEQQNDIDSLTGQGRC